MTGWPASSAGKSSTSSSVTYSSVEELTDEDIEDFPAEDAGQPVTGPAGLPDGTGQDTLPA